MRALIVDDNEQILDVLSFFCESNKIDYTTVNNGKQALTTLFDTSKDPSKSFGLIFLDIAMPEMSGFQVIETLKKEKLTDSKIIIVLTALELTPEDENRLIKYGVTDIVRKPISIEDIENILHKYIKTN